MSKRRLNWFKAVLVVGLGLGGLLLIEAIATYHYVTGHLVFDHLQGEAGRLGSHLETLAWQIDPRSNEELVGVLDRVREEYSGRISWVRVAGQDGEVLAASRDASYEPLPAETLQSLLADRKRIDTEFGRDLGEDVLVVTLPFRFRLASERTVVPEEAGRLGRPRFALVQIALYLHGAEDPFRPLRRNLIVSIAAAVALVASMVLFMIRVPGYLRGREFEQQMTLARQVQRDLLPDGCPECEEFEFAAVCIAAWEVGGDYYDFFRTADGWLTLALGDVSGKGLPAALLMSLAHGSVRSASRGSDGRNLTELMEELNKLLLIRSSSERFMTLFWALCDPGGRRLYYVNAGHLPPLLVRRDSRDRLSFERLEEGGPVLGLLPSITFTQGEVNLQPGDLLLLYSDGVVEAMDAAGCEFGEQRLFHTLESNLSRSAEEIMGQILETVRRFVGNEALHDDLTLCVARVQAPQPITDHGVCCKEPLLG